jgi:hypothetical protein
MFEFTGDATKLEVRPESRYAAEPKDSEYRLVLVRQEDIAKLKAEKNPALIGLNDKGRPTDKEAEVVKWAVKLKVTPPDFLMHPLRAIHDDPQDPNHAKNDIFRTIAAGIGGVAMPGFRKKNPDKAKDAENVKEIWAVAHFVNSVRAMRGKPEAQRYRTSLDEAFTPPAPPAPAEPAPSPSPAPAAPTNP